MMRSVVLLISGMLPTGGDGQLVGKGDPTAQAEQVFQNIGAVLSAAGATFADVVKLNIYLTDIGLRSAIAPVREACFGQNKPASTLQEISRLAHPDALLEVEAIAYL
ncbi:RidA family protein [Paenibacillus thalictri]|uniref:RidA family protein n=1 Tax=Paenibacillus thalictri TaxID=2527873 RepID=A0A4V2J3S5_9BACL|nr:RidA family protein [Paenibacillus thalictri]TBL75256.1 RidA family protein [Paenibacillus thalictri]